MLKECECGRQNAELLEEVNCFKYIEYRMARRVLMAEVSESGYEGDRG